MPNAKLRRFYEASPLRKRTNRFAYVVSIAAMPDASEGAEWREDPTFIIAEAALADPGLKRVISAAIDKSCVIVEQPK